MNYGICSTRTVHGQKKICYLLTWHLQDFADTTEKGARVAWVQKPEFASRFSEQDAKLLTAIGYGLNDRGMIALQAVPLSQPQDQRCVGFGMLHGKQR